MFTHTKENRIMRVLSWTLLLAGISVFTIGCTEATTPVETDNPPAVEGEDHGHEHAEGEGHGEAAPVEGEVAPVEGEVAPVEPAPEVEAPAPEGDAAAPAEPELDLNIEN